jgi:hypothetical protein
MPKRVLIGLVVAISLLVLSGADAGAATCIQYRVVGGTAFCTAWKTKGVLFEIKFKEACLVFSGEGEISTLECTALATAVSQPGDSLAFCSDGTVQVCNVQQTFTGDTASAECVAKHEDKDPGGRGVGHSHHGCTAAVILNRTTSCDSCCTGHGTCQDVTPFEMDTQVIVSAAGFGSESEGASCIDSDTCEIQEHCSINPKKIQLVSPTTLAGSKDYQCNLQCVGDACPTFPPGGGCETDC